MKCPICGKDLDLQNKQIGTSENGDPIFNEYAICHSCKKQWNLDKQRAKKIAAKKAAEEKAKAEAEARAAEEKAKAEAAARAAEEKAKAEAAARAAEEKAKAERAARAAEEKAKAEKAARAAEEKAKAEKAARREAKARARKEAIARLAADKGISEEEAERILKERARARKAAAQKAATVSTDATDDSEEQKYGNIPAEEIRDKREKAVRKGYEDMLATDPDSKASKKKKKEEAETAKAKEDVKSRKMDNYDDEKSSDDEYEYIDEYPRFRPGRIILGIISLLAFGFCIYKGFVTGLSTSGADVTSAPGMNYVIVALCMLVTALLYFIMNNRDTLFAFLIPMILYIGGAVFAFLKHGDEFELLVLAGVSGVLAVISLILAIASRGGDDYDDEDDYDDPFEEEHDN